MSERSELTGAAAEPAPRRRFGRRNTPPATPPAPARRAPSRSVLRPFGPHYVIAPREVSDAELSAAMGSLRPVPNALVVVAAAADAAPVLREQMAELGLIARTRGASSLILAASGLAALGPGGRRPAEVVADKAGIPVVAPDGLVSIQPDGTLKVTAPEGSHEPATWWNCLPGGRPRRLRETVEATTALQAGQPEAGPWPPPAVPSRTVAAPGPTALPVSVAVHRLATGFWLNHVTARPEPAMPFLRQLATPPGTTPLLVGTPTQPVLAPEEFADAALSLPTGSDQLVVSAPWADPGALAVLSGTLAERLGRPVHASVGLPVAHEGVYTARMLDHRGATTWEPYLIRLTSTGRHDTVGAAWRNGGAAWRTVGPGLFDAFPFWCLEAVPAGLWLRPEPPYAWAPRLLRPDPARPLLVVGERARLITHDVWEQLSALLDQLPAPGVRGFGLLLHGLVDSASESSARFFARMHGLVWLNPPAHAKGGQPGGIAGPAPAVPTTYAVGGGFGAPSVPERFTLAAGGGAGFATGPVRPRGAGLPSGADPGLPSAVDPGHAASAAPDLLPPAAPPAGLATSSGGDPVSTPAAHQPAAAAGPFAAEETATAAASAGPPVVGRPSERPSSAAEPVCGPVRTSAPDPAPPVAAEPAAPAAESAPAPGQPVEAEASVEAPAPVQAEVSREAEEPEQTAEPTEAPAPAEPAPSLALAARYFGAADALALAPVSSAADRDAFRALLGEHYQRGAGRVEPAVTRLPGLRSSGRDDFKPDLVAVLLHHEGAAVPAGRTAVVAEARGGAPGPLAPYFACLASGLRRLPSHHGAVLLGTDLPPEVLEAYPPGLALVEPAPVTGLSSPAADLGTEVEFVVWSTTGRRTAVFGADGEVPQVAFGPGTGFVVVETVPGDGAARPARVLLRETGGTVATAPDAERDRSARERLRAWLERRDKVAPADRRTVARPERFRLTPGAALPEPRPEPLSEPVSEPLSVRADPDPEPAAEA
ncbi:hypothetical protein ABZW30_45800 [Kitasatospora sp. NPDC004669]|uniref:hypothetical protein n=1 Tax=Kitasatospora sp. NPDC004669 TaxID=3154555 RepID=UPI0033B017C0